MLAGRHPRLLDRDAGGVAASVRRLLAVHFVARLADPAHEALWIWFRNSKMTAGVAVAIALVALVQWISPAGRAGAERIPLWFADSILGVWSLLWAALAGVALGAYGSAQLGAFLPDSPVEVAAWALLLSLYVNARRGQGGWRQTLWDWCRSRRCWRSPRSSKAFVVWP